MATDTEDEVRHIHTYKGKLCESLPGTPPMMVPVAGTTCEKCQKRDKEFRAKHRIKAAS